jgi:hypothetical protein
MADWLDAIYQQGLGRNVDPSGRETYGPRQNDPSWVLADIMKSPEGQAYAAGKGGDGSGGEIDSSAFASTSSSSAGLPSDVQGMVTPQISQYLSTLMSGLQGNTNSPFASTVQSTIQNLQNNPYLSEMMKNYQSYAQNTPGQIEQLRQAQGSQYLAGMTPLQQQYQPALDAMAKRGIVNSSVTGDALSNIQQQINRGYEQTVAGANTDAAKNLLAYQQGLPGMASTLAGTYGTQTQLPGAMALQQEQAQTAQQGLFANTIAALINASRQSQSQGYQPSPYVAQYMLGY